VRSAAALVAGSLLALACGGARASLPPAQPEDQIRFAPHDSLLPLDRLPYDQPYAFVAPSRIFRGLFAIDDAPRASGDVASLKASIRLPLEALGWYEVPEEEARYLVVALVAERTVLRQNRLTNLPSGRARTPAEWEMERYENRPRSGNDMPVGRIFRGYAIASRSGGVVYRVYNADRATAEAAIGAEIIERVMGKAP
jgi:hypothetical protein